MKFDYSHKKSVSGKKKKKKKKKKTISFCMTCMNRLHHVKKTLKAGIFAHKSCEDIEFVLLNYNSQDDLDEWVKKHMMKYIKSGILNYYQMIEFKPNYFDWRHAKNIVHKLGTGDILCNLDADNFADRSNTDYIRNMFRHHKDDDIFLSPCWQEKYHGIMGRICLRRDKFNALQGYNEISEYYGLEDIDIVKRLRLSGSKRQCFNPKPPLRCIMHSDAERLHLSKFAGLEDDPHIWNMGASIYRRYRKKYGFQANRGYHWGKAKLIKNFTTEIVEV